MNEYISIGTFVITVGGLIGTFFKAKGMDEAQQKIIDEKLKELHEIDDKQWKAIDYLKKIDIDLEKSDWKVRSELELKIASHDGIIGQLNGKLDSIEKKLDALINDFKQGRHS